MQSRVTWSITKGMKVGVVALAMMVAAGGARAQDAADKVPPPPTPAGIPVDAGDLENAAQQAAAAATAEADAEAREVEEQEKHNRESFERATSSLMPLSPDQVRDFMKRLEVEQEASLPPSGGPPKPEVKAQTLSLDPGVEPPEIKVAAGYVTTITFLDATGEPWPILDVGTGGNFEVSPTQNGSHVVRLTPLSAFANGNMSILLKDLKTPVILRLVAGGPSVYMRYDARVPQFGPNAKVPIIDRRKLAAGDELIMMFLDNTPPRDARKVRVGGVDTRTAAWRYNDKMFLRTPLSMLSPAWNASVSSADGMTVYEIGDAPVVLLSDNGVMLRARLMQEDDNDR